MMRQSFALFTVMALIGCRGSGRLGASVAVPVPSATVSDSRSISFTIAERPGRLSVEEFERIAGTIRTLVAEPTEVRVGIGEAVRLDDVLRVVARDSLGVVLGELPYYDYAFAGRGFRLLADGHVRFGRQGTVRVTVRMPNRLWRQSELPRPSAQATVVVVK